jgi:hypothetical protein
MARRFGRTTPIKMVLYNKILGKVRNFSYLGCNIGYEKLT